MAISWYCSQKLYGLPGDCTTGIPFGHHGLRPRNDTENRTRPFFFAHTELPPSAFPTGPPNGKEPAGTGRLLYVLGSKNRWVCITSGFQSGEAAAHGTDHTGTLLVFIKPFGLLQNTVLNFLTEPVFFFQKVCIALVIDLVENDPFI